MLWRDRLSPSLQLCSKKQLLETHLCALLHICPPEAFSLATASPPAAPTLPSHTLTLNLSRLYLVEPGKNMHLPQHSTLLPCPEGAHVPRHASDMPPVL